MRVPIRNVYFLLQYAWNVIEEAGVIAVDPAKYKTVPDLLGAVLGRGVNHLLRQGIDRGYVVEEQEVSGVRGRILIAATIQRNALTRAATVCAVDELTADIPHNQILKTTIRALIQDQTIDSDVRGELRDTCTRLRGISEIALNSTSFRKVQLHRNIGLYGLLLSLCALLAEGSRVVEKGRRTVFASFDVEKLMGQVFEAFLFNFYAREQREYRVKRQHLHWKPAVGSLEDVSYLPIMRTDVSLQSEKRSIVVEAKYYSRTTEERFGSRKLHSGNLYQLFAYLANLAAAGTPAEGLLIYPRVDEDLSLNFVIHQHTIRVRTLNLESQESAIREELLKFVAE